MNDLENTIVKHQHSFDKLVPFNPTQQKIVALNLTESNTDLTTSIVKDILAFCNYINTYLQQHQAIYAIGGYNELRTMYSRSEVFNDATEPRRLHLGMDIWGKVGTPVFAPLGGMVHSVGFNHAFGDYGGTVILQHQLAGLPFHTLYGHLSKHNVQVLKEGMYISMGEQIGNFGTVEENGCWPPHLHFQIIEDMQLKEGDYPGVCKASEAGYYLHNCINPDVIVQMNKYV
jgi:peptidoglycan LD-endopeptidase LytH